MPNVTRIGRDGRMYIEHAPNPLSDDAANAFAQRIDDIRQGLHLRENPRVKAWRAQLEKRWQK